jgi:hypothetical protein
MWQFYGPSTQEESPDGSDPASKMVLTQGSTSTCISDKSDVCFFAYKSRMLETGSWLIPYIDFLVFLRVCLQVEMNTAELWRNVDDILKDKDDLFKNGVCSHDRVSDIYCYK